MASIEEIRTARLEKINLLKKKGVNPYPIKSGIEFSLSELDADFKKLEKKKSVSAGGRVMSIRPQGGLAFFNLYDGTGKFQGLLKKDEVGEENFDFFVATVDIGDFIQVDGSLFVTKRNEKTILVSKWTMLSKSLRPLPDKWHGLQDVEERFRKRYLDLICAPEVKERFIVRSKIITEIRKIYDEDGYVEVETPRLQSMPGGATARPFVTHHNALDTDFYLTIAQELFLKKLLIGGLNKVYEIGRKFRNEGIDVTHNPEFTMLESNEAFADAESQRDFIEKLFRRLVKTISGKTVITYGGQEIDFGKPFAVITFYDLLRRYALIPNPEKLTLAEAKLKASQLGVKVGETESLDKILDGIYKIACRPKLIQPTFIIDYPVDFNPFAKRTADPSLIDRFQLIAGELELVNAFSELNNPIDQAERYAEQDIKKKAGEGEVSPSDKEYLEAMEHGMPPNGGIGIGIDRVVMLLTDQKNIREVILFPTLRPKN